MANYTDGLTKTCGIIGNPVKHTMSPLIHNTLAQRTGMNLVYVPFEVRGGLKEAIEGAYQLGIYGMNVTVPYKSAVLPFLKDIDPLAESIGAVNTLVRDEKKGGFKGYNTDMTGLYRAIRQEGIELEGKTIVILGAGGVARPVAHLCKNKGAEKIFILNRTLEKAEAIASDFSDGTVMAMDIMDYGKVLKSLGNEKFFCFQCTSVGLYPDTDAVVIDDKKFYESMYAALDVIYRPLETEFLKLAKEAGAKTFSGLKMLLYQGVDAYELWNERDGIRIDKDLCDEVYRSLEREVIGARNILLQGFMGSGKTTVSELLADKLDMELIDTDEAIQSAEGMTVNEIFEEMGQDGFRDLETDLAGFFVSDHLADAVISLGGGLPLRPENRELMKKLGKVVYLKASAETIYERLKYDDTRPLLKCDDPLSRIKELMAQRESIYEESADIVIETDGKTPQEITDLIVKALNE